MKLGLKNKIETSIKAYKENGAAQGEELKIILEPFQLPSYADAFTKEGMTRVIKEQWDEVVSDWKKFDNIMNQQVKTTVESARKDLMEALNMKKAQKPDDYAIRIANAREFMKMELDSNYSKLAELDSALFFILKDFTDDYDTMKLFSKMVEKKYITYDAMTGACSLPKTFGKMMKVDSIMNTLNEVDEAAAMLFLHARTSGQVFVRIKGNAYTLPTDGYAEINDEETIINNAAILDMIADKIDTDGQSSSSEVHPSTDAE